jgi:hypothetical protein
VRERLTSDRKARFQVENFLTKPVQDAQLTAILRTGGRRTVGATLLPAKRCSDQTRQDSCRSQSSLCRGADSR